MRQTWLLPPSRLEQLHVLGERLIAGLRPGALDEYMTTGPAAAEDEPEDYELRGDVAVVRISGVLQEEPDIWSWLFGCGSPTYSALRRGLAAAALDGRARAILLEVDSPGGDVAGCRATVQAVAAARASKPVVARVMGECLSAAYWIASAADSIEASPTALVGCVGVVAAVLEVEGLRRYVSSQTPAKSIATPEGEAAFQQALDDLAAVFIADVAAARGLAEDDLGAGATLVGQRALDAGLVDVLRDESEMVMLSSAAAKGREGAMAEVRIDDAELASLRAAAERTTALEAQALTASAERAEAQRAHHDAEARIARLESVAREREREAELERHVRRGAVAPGALADWRADYDAAPEVTRRALARLPDGAVVPQGVVGRHATDAERASQPTTRDQVHDLIVARVNKDTDYQAAMAALFREQPDLRRIAFPGPGQIGGAA